MEDIAKEELISRGNDLGLNGNGGSAWEDQYIGGNDAVENSQSTLIPATLETASVVASTSTVSTIIIISLSIIVAIGLLFVLAIFIDYRQQKISERQQQQCIIKRKKPFKLRMPNCRRVRNQNGIVEDAEETSQTSPPLETIHEVV